MAEIETKEQERPQTLGTDCTECIFFEDTKKCKLGIIEQFKQKGAYFEEIDGKFLVDRICSFRRTEEWKEDKSIEECAEKVKHEVKMSGTIVVKTNCIHDLDQCLSNLSKMKHVENFKILITHHSELAVREVFDYLEGQEHFADCLAIRVNEGDVHSGKVHFLDEALKRSKNGFIVTIDSSKPFPLNLLNKLYHFIYVKMNRLLYVPADDENNHSVVHAFIYKFLKGNKFWGFEEKLEQVTEHQNLKSQITSWDKINEEYND